MTASFAPTIRLSSRQRELLWMDSYGEYPEPTPAPELAGLRRELHAGTIIHLDAAVMAQLRELADRDQDVAERTIYQRLLRNATRIKDNREAAAAKAGG